MLKFSTTDEQAKGNGVKVCVYGRSGVGKTRLCATAPSPIIASAEKGLLSLRHKQVPTVEITSLVDLIDFHSWAQLSAEARHVETLCLDSVTEIAEKVLANALTQVKDPRQAYGELYTQTIKMIKDFRDLERFNVYFVALQSMGSDAGGLIGPLMPGKQLTAKFPSLFDELFRMDVGALADGTPYEFLATRPDYQYDAKDRSGALDAVEEPNLTKIINKIQNV
jgi:hypothetical protein